MTEKKTLTVLDTEPQVVGDATRLPSLGAPDSPSFLSAVKETLEVLTGRRGLSKLDRAVTFRDLHGALPNLSQANRQRAHGASLEPLGSDTTLDASIRQSAAYRELVTRIGSVADLESFPDEIRETLRRELGKLALERGAAVEESRQIVQDANKSFASKLSEVTAAYKNLSAGVRHLDFAFANRYRAQAASITQVTARINNADGPGSGVTIEEKFLAQAETNGALLGQWSIKIMAGSDANPVMAGLGLSVEGPNADELTSALVFLAHKFGMYTPAGVVNPFSADEFGVNINGTLRVNGTALQDIIAGAKRLQMIASSQVFKIAKDLTVSPATITFTGLATGLTGAPVFTLTQQDGTVSTIAGTGDSRSVAFADLTGEFATITVTQDGREDKVTVQKLREGLDAVVAFLTNEASVLAASETGVVSDYSPAAGNFKLYKGTVDVTAGASYAVLSETGCDVSINASTGAYTVASMSTDTATAVLRASYAGATYDKTLTLSKSKQGQQGEDGVAAYVTVSATGHAFARADSLSSYSPASITLTATNYGGGASFQWQYWTGAAWSTISGATSSSYAVGSGDFADTRTFRCRATIAGTAYYDDITIAHLTGGLDGVDGLTGLLTNESATLPATSAGTVTSFSGASGNFKVYKGITDVTASCSFSVASETGCDASITAGGAYSVASMSADAATATLRATYSGTTIDKVLTLAKARAGTAGSDSTVPGPDGPQGASYVTAYCASSDTTATSTPAATTGATSVPSGGVSGTWQKTVPALASNQYLYQSDGIYNPTTDQVTWSKPYWSSLKVGQLSAVAADLGEVTAGTYKTNAGTGQRVTINESANNKIRIYDSSNTVVTELGGATGKLFIDSAAGLFPAVYGKSGAGSTLVAGVYGENTSSGSAVFGSAGSGIGVRAVATSGKGLYASASTGDAIEIAGGANGIVQTGGGSNYLRNVLPATDNAYSVGASGVLRFTAVYAMSATITTSDLRTKTAIVDSPLGLAFINDLRPIRYKMIVGQNVVTDNFVEVAPARIETDEHGNQVEIAAVIENRPTITPRAGTRDHFGLPAQQLREALLAHGQADAAMWCLADPNDPESQQAVRYEELIPVLIKGMQELSEQVLYLQSRLAVLEAADE